MIIRLSALYSFADRVERGAQVVARAYRNSLPFRVLAKGLGIILLAVLAVVFFVAFAVLAVGVVGFYLLQFLPKSSKASAAVFDDEDSSLPSHLSMKLDSIDLNSVEDI